MMYLAIQRNKVPVHVTLWNVQNMKIHRGRKWNVITIDWGDGGNAALEPWGSWRSR